MSEKLTLLLELRELLKGQIEAAEKDELTPEEAQQYDLRGKKMRELVERLSQHYEEPDCAASDEKGTE